MASPTPGYCTFTATGRPSVVTARCTWPIDAAASGSSSHSANSSPMDRPRASSTVARANSDAIGGALAWSSASASRTGSGKPWSR